MSLRRASAGLLIIAGLWAAGGSALGAGEPNGGPGEPDPGAQVRATFAQYCAACHAGPSDEPVNFLNPAVGTPAGAIAQCAERIAFRLILWDWPEALRPLAPMPPADWLAEQGLDPDAWTAGGPRAALRVYLAGLLALTGSSTVRVEQSGSLDPEGLRPCLAEAGP